MNIPPFDKRFKKNHIHDIKIICLHHSFYIKDIPSNISQVRTRSTTKQEMGDDEECSFCRQSRGDR
jgi:hypothetical protein